MKDMLGRGEALEVEKALDILFRSATLSPPGTETLALENSCARVLARAVVSEENIPAFARSTMDGYAVRSADTFGASETGPAYLDIIGEVLMGQEATMSIGPGKTVRIATGGMLPKGADAIVMFEYTSPVDSNTIEIQKSAAPGEHVIQKGEDMCAGEDMLPAGARLRAQDVAVLASAGITEASVFKRPTVAIISTGDEIVPPTEPVVKPGIIRDSNSYHLAALISSLGAEPVKRGIMPDELAPISRAVGKSVDENDLVLITGGSSVGTRDMTERAIEAHGEVLFHQVKLKPGKPFLAGLVNGKPVFGLPGHPRAVSVCFETFVRPVLRRLSGESSMRAGSGIRTLKARLTKGVHSSSGRKEHIDVIIQERDGGIWAEPVPGKSGLLRTMVRSDGNICLPVGTPGLEAGETVEITLFE